MAEAGMRSPHNLEVYPTQADRFQLGSDVIFEQGGPPERLASLTRKHVRFGILVHRLLHPIAKQRGSRGRDRNCTDQTVLWSRELPSIDAPADLDHRSVRFDVFPLNGQEFAGAHPSENSKPEYHLLPAFDCPQCQFDLLSGHRLALAALGGLWCIKRRSRVYPD